MTKKKEKKPVLPSAPVGRPSLYDPKYCEMLITHMAEGLSFESFAGILGHSKQTLYTWTEEHREFLDAKKQGEAKSLLWWESEGRKGLWEETTKEEGENGFMITKTRKLNTVNWLFNMKNRHSWRSEKEITVTTGEESFREKIKKLSMAELTELVKDNIQAEGKK